MPLTDNGLGGSGGGSALVGEIKLWPLNTLPNNFLACDGAAISRTTYAGLFSILGTVYGTGDGSTTFNTPNLKGRIPVGLDAAQAEFNVLGETGGEKTHQLTVTEMPSHSHGVSGGNSSGTIRGLMYENDNAGTTTGSSGGNGAHNNLQPYLILNYIIRYQ